MAADPPVSKAKRGKAPLKKRSTSSLDESSHRKTVSFSASYGMVSKLFSPSEDASQSTVSKKSWQSTGSKMRSKAERLAALKRQRRMSRKKQLLQGPPGRYESNDRQRHEKKQRKQSHSPVAKEVPITEMNGTVVGADDATLTTLGTLNTLQSTQLSVMSGQYSIASAYWDAGSYAGSCGFGMLSPFSTEGLHDRIRHQIELACTESYHRKGTGTRLSSLAAAQKSYQRDVESGMTMCGRDMPVSFYGALKSMKERFRSDVVQDCSDEVDEPLVVRLQKNIPTKEELERYASQAKQTLLETIETFEKARKKAGQTVGPIIERLREETESSCIQGDAWCRDHYASLSKTSAELHEHMAKTTGECLAEKNFNNEDGKALLDPPEGDDMSIIDDMASTPCSGEEVIMKRLKNAATTFLEHYAAFLSMVVPSLATETGAVLELPADFGHDSKKHPIPREVQKGEVDGQAEENGGVQNSQDFDDLQGPGESGVSGASEESEEALESEDFREEPETSETQDVHEASEDLGVTNYGRVPESLARKSVDPDEGPGPQEPDGVKPAGAVSVEASLASSIRSRKVPLAKSDASQTNGHPARNLANSSSDGGHGNGRGQGSFSFYSLKGGNPINHVDSRDDASRGRPNKIDPEEAARLDRASASVWKKLRDLNKKNKVHAVSMLGDIIEPDDDDVGPRDPSVHIGVEDEVSLMTNGTQENPIVLLDPEESEFVERPNVNKNNNGKMRAVAEATGLSSKDAQRLLALEEQSQVSGLTATEASTAATGAAVSSVSVKSELKEDLEEFVGEYLGSRDERDEACPNRLEAAEHLLTTLKAHMNERQESKQNVFMQMEDSETSDLTRDLEGNAQILPRTKSGNRRHHMHAGTLPRAKPYRPRAQALPPRYSREAEPEIIRVIDDELPPPMMINLVTTNSDILPPGVEDEPQPAIVPHYKSKLLADPHRHAMISKDKAEPPEVMDPHYKSKLLADPHRHAMINKARSEPPEVIDLAFPSAEAAIANGYNILNARAEQRDDQQGGPAHQEPTRRQDAFLHQNPPTYRYSKNLPTSRLHDPPAGVFREQKLPSSFSSLPSDVSETKSVTSSILGKRIPRRSKSVSFNLPDDDSNDAERTVQSKKGSIRSRTSIRSTAAVASVSSSGGYSGRVAAARRELARLSQRQAALMSSRN